ncbi:hypothetical protein ACIBSW_06960 [Actinoplanes sp. NPDC049668]|uniref:hypothetical protein n=1 Tax=unclassified Actinoplanes TaxID=2626549 RepID=UPI0033A6987D
MEENEQPQRRQRTPNPAFSTPEQPTPQSKPAKAPPAVTFRPPSETKKPSGTPAGAKLPAKSATRRPTPAKPDPATAETAAPQPPAKKAAKAQPAAKSSPPRVEVSAPTPPVDEPEQAPKKAPPAKAQPAKAQPAKAQPVKAQKAQPAKAQPAKVAAPAKSAAAKVATPAKTAAAKVAATVKAAAAEVAPAVVAPDMTTVPDEETAAATPAPDAPTLPRRTTPATDSTSVPRTEAWAALIADPGHSPELLALAATQTIGPRAQRWARRTRDAYPTATADGLARLAVEQVTRFGGVSSLVAAAAGSYAPVALLGAGAFTQAELALHVAAAYGLDPTDPERAAELLVLARVYPGRQEAAAALAVAQGHGPESAGLTEANRRLGGRLAVKAGGWAAIRVVNRYFPGAAVLAAVLGSRGAAAMMAARATFYYRGQSQVSQRSGSSV